MGDRKLIVKALTYMYSMAVSEESIEKGYGHNGDECANMLKRRRDRLQEIKKLIYKMK